MIVPKNIFLFFFCNHLGQAYFLDVNGNVQLGNIASGIDYSLPDSPVGWIDQELSWARNQKYYGFNRSYSPELKFVRKSAQLLRKIFYLGKGVNQQVYFVATKINTATGNYELYYKGEIDFPEQMDDDPVEGVTVKTMEGGLLKLIKSYENTVFEIPLDGSIAENINVSINGLMFVSVFNFQVAPFSFKSNGTVLPIAFTTEQGNDVGIIRNSQNYKEFDVTNQSSIQNNVLATGNYCFNSIRPILRSNPQGGLNISGSLTFSGSMSTGRLFVQYGDSATNHYDIIPAQAIGAQTLQFNTNIDANGGQAIFLCFECDGSSGAAITGGTIKLSFNSQFEDTNAYYLKPTDVLKLLLQKICMAASEPGHSISYQYSSSLLQQYNNLCLTSGSALRNIPNAVLKISLSTFFEIYNPILNASMGNEVIDTGMGEDLFFEKKEAVYDSTNVDVDLGEVARFKMTPAYEMFFDTLKIGYQEQKYDNKQGNDEYNTTAIYKAPHKIAKEFSLVSKARGDSFGHEYTRYLVGTTNTSNNKSDSDIFITNIDLSQHNNTGIVINGDTASAPVSSVKIHDYTMGIEPSTILKWPVIFKDIQGTSFKNSFSLNDKSLIVPTNSVASVYHNAKIQFNNTAAGFTNVTGTIFLAGKVDGILLAYYTNPTLFRHSSYSSLKYKTGTYNVKFSLQKNGNEIASATVPITIGQEFQVYIDVNDNLYFGDSYSILWSLSDAVLIGDRYYMQINGSNQEVLPSAGLTGLFTAVTFSLSDINQAPVYGLKRVAYDSIVTGTMLNPAWAYNIEDLSISRMMDKWSNWFRSIFYNQPNASFKFQSSDKNHVLSTTLSGKTFSEGTDIPIGSMNSNILFYPWIFEFDTEIPIGFLELMNKVRNAHIRGTYYGIPFYGFAEEVKVKPALNESQHWRLLASPKCDMSALTNFDLSGINLLNLPKMSAMIPHTSPVKFYPLGKTKDPRYNFTHMDDDWYQEQISFWIQRPKPYYQKWQQNDTISLAAISNAIGPAVITVYDDKQNVVTTINMTQKTDAAVKSPKLLFQQDISLSTFNEGHYYFVISIGVGSTVDQFISEGLHVKANWPVTLLFQYKNSINKNATIFSTGYYPSFRVEGWIDDYNPRSHVSAFEDQPANMRILNAINFGQHKLNIGRNYGVPPYVIRLMNEIMGFDDVLIDGHAFARYQEDSEFEKTKVPNHPMEYWTLDIRESENELGVVAITSGNIEDEFFVTYNVDQKGFGEFVSGTNVVPIKKVE